ncbi:MAG: hypothetical protein Q7U99_28025 [Rubrivivax sp.]|nr:hypothetical protein [Rubrivivax sp.]
MKMLQRLLSLMALLALAACGGGGGNAGNPGFGDGAGGGGGGGGGGTVTPVVTIELGLIDGAGAASSNVLAGSPLRARAVLRRNGEAVANEIVQFAAEQSSELVRIDPNSGSQLTDASGVAIVTVSSLGTASGAGRIRASATVGTVSASNATNFFASAGSTTPPSTLTLGPIAIGSSTVSAYGTTGVRVQVLQAGVPYTAGLVTVNFTSSCASGKATITPTASTQPDGFAVATFVDNGCAQTAATAVTITASISTDTESGTLNVLSPTTGSLRFLSVVPSDKSITLRGQGGNGRQENATVTFQLVDVAGQGVGNADVCFDSSTYIGSLNIDGFGPGALPSSPGSTALCGADSLSVIRYVKRTNPDGTVVVQVNSGTVPTPVRVRARAVYPSTSSVALESFSDTLSVSTGLPLQRSFSLSVDKANIDGGNFDGEVAVVTVRLADQFSNPVPDGTVVNFIGSGASVCTSNNGSCRTTNGACSCNVVSQARRPLDNRVIVTAYAVGLEDFDDQNGDNLYTPGTDPFYDLGDAYVDANKDGIPSSATINSDTDILIPYQNPSAFTPGGDGARGTAHIRASTVIYLSRSSSLGDPTVVVPLANLSRENSLTAATSSSPFVRLQPFCPSGVPVPQTTITTYLDDGIGNPMAAATSLAAADPSTNISTGGFRPASVLAVGARGPFASLDLPNLPKITPWSTTTTNVIATPHSITVRGVEDKCSGEGSFSLQVTSPRGGAASARILYEGEPRSVGRAAFDVRYRNVVSFTATQGAGGSGVIAVQGNSWIGSADRLAAGATSAVNCGRVGVAASAGGTPGAFSCSYGAGASGTVSITYTVTDSAGSSYSNSTSVLIP